MSEEKPDKSYGLEPVEDEAAAASAAPQPRRIDEPEREAAESEFPEPGSIKALDVCPNCGSPLGGVDAVVCLRCGFDLKTLKVIKVETGETAASDDEEEPEPAEPLCVPAAGGLQLPAVLAGGSLLLLALGYLFGAGGLVGGGAEETVGFGARIGGLLRMLVRTGGLSLAGMGGLVVLAHMLDRPLGDLRLAAVRMLGIFATIGLVAFFNIESARLEGVLEAIFEAILFVGAAALFFRLSMRDAATLMGVTAFAVIILLLFSWLVLWSARMAV